MVKTIAPELFNSFLKLSNFVFRPAAFVEKIVRFSFFCFLPPHFVFLFFLLIVFVSFSFLMVDCTFGGFRENPPLHEGIGN